MSLGVQIRQKLEPLSGTDPVIGNAKITLKTASVGPACQLFDPVDEAWFTPGLYGTFNIGSPTTNEWISPKLPCLDSVTGTGNSTALELGFYYEIVVTTTNPADSSQHACTYEVIVDCVTQGLVNDQIVDLEDIVADTPVDPLPGSPICQTVQACETVTTMVDNGNDTHTYTNEAGVDITFPTGGGGGGGPETVTTMAAGANGTYVYTNEAASPFTIDPVDSIVNHSENDLSYDGGTGILSFVKHDGTTQQVTLPTENFLSNATYNDVTNILTLTMDEGTSFDIDLSDLVDAETVTSMVINGNGTVTYTNEDNVATVFKTADRNKMVFAQTAQVTATGRSGVEIFETDIIIDKYVITANTLPSSTETWIIEDATDDSVLASLSLPPASPQAIVNLGSPINLTAGTPIRVNVISANGS